MTIICLICGEHGRGRVVMRFVREKATAQVADGALNAPPVLRASYGAQPRLHAHPRAQVEHTSKPTRLCGWMR